MTPELDCERGTKRHPAVSNSIKHLLFPTDFSQLAFEAATTAAELARATGARVTVLHVDESLMMHRYWQYGPEAGRAPSKAKDVREAIAERLTTELSQAHWRGIRTDKVILEGNAALEIAGYARRENVDLIVIPCQGESPYKENLLGGTARKVAELAPCSVLLVRRRGTLPGYGERKPGAAKPARPSS